MKVLIAQFLRFALVGIAGTGAHYMVLWALVEQAKVPVLIATSMGFVVGALTNYWLNRRYTFTSTASHAAAFPRFLTIAAAGAILNAIIVAWLLARWRVHYLIIQLLATGTVLIWNFLANYLWTFKKTSD
jgi:putative flippase GtrA